VNQKALSNLLKLFIEQKITAFATKEFCSPPSALPYYAHNLDFRVNDLKKALADKDVKILWCLRGGYGSAEVATHIDTPPTTLKTIIGYSDITALNFLFIQKFNLPVIHGGISNKIAESEKGSEVLGQIIDIVTTSKDLSYKISLLTYKLEEPITGKLVGGNLTIITNLIGTHLHPQTKDSILVIEDTGERGYKIMRDLQHLKQAGILDGLKALIFGDFDSGDEPDGKNYVEATIEEFISQLSIPCFRIKDCGHGPVNTPLILGTDATIRPVLGDNVTDYELEIKNPF
jgi:muramoyltetrapeptide carboxypeptidase